MKTTRFLVLLNFCLYLLVAPFIDNAAAQQELFRIAVLDFSGVGVSPAAAKTLTDRFRSELVKTGGFVVLERDQMDEVLKEQGFQQSGCVSDECLVEAGRLIGVQKMVGGNIGKIGQTYTFDIRLIDVESGKIESTVTEDYKGDVDGLLQVLRKTANGLAGTSDVSSSGGGVSWLWIGLGAVAAGAAAAVLLGSSGSGSGDESDADLPAANEIWPPPSN